MASHPPLCRCAWARDELMIAYHDNEWGVPQHDDRVLFEFLILEGAQAGLSWSTILNKRENYRAAFDGFNARRIAKYDDAKVAALLANPGIVRNRLKVASTILNARAFLAVQKEFGSFDAYVWSFVGGRPKQNAWPASQSLPARTAGVRCTESRPVAARLQVRGLDDLLRLHAGRRDGQRPRHRLLSLSGSEEAFPLTFRALRSTSTPRTASVPIIHPMTSLTRLFLPLIALVAFAAAPLSAADTIELKQRWIAGKQYFLTAQTTQQSKIEIGPQKIDQTVTTTMDMSMAVRQHEDGKRKRMTMKFERVAMEMNMNGQKMGFDSAKPGEGTDPLGLAKSSAPARARNSRCC